MATQRVKLNQFVNLQAATPRGRINRHPRHPFALRQRPYELTPFLLAPVLPGETLVSATLQARAVTDPILNKLGGWWNEYWIFYVKHRDLVDLVSYATAATVLQNMMLDTATSVAALQLNGGDAWKYVADDDIDWVGMCLERVVKAYFRADGEASADYVIDAGHPAARMVGESWLDSVVDRETILDPDDTVLVNEAGSGTLLASELDAAMRQWEFLRQNNLTNMDYEDFLATYGVRLPQVEEHRPELLRHIRDWAYPSNTVSPSDGSVKSAVSWIVAESVRKQRFFSEPGFIFGVTCARPKAFWKQQVGHAAGVMNNALRWLPAIMNDDPATSLAEVASTDGPLQNRTHNYVIDIKDLLIYGDQYCNFTPANGADMTVMDLPNAALSNKWYPALADVKAIFVDTADAAGLTKVRQDGIVSLTIAGRQADTT